MFEIRVSRKDEDHDVLSATEHNHVPEPDVKRARQITTSDSDRMNHAWKWMSVDPREFEKPASKINDILYREANPYLNIAKASTKDAAVQTEPDTGKKILEQPES